MLQEILTDLWLSPAQRLTADRIPEAEVLFLPLGVRAILLENRCGGGRIGWRRRRRIGARRQGANHDRQNSRSHPMRLLSFPPALRSARSQHGTSNSRLLPRHLQDERDRPVPMTVPYLPLLLRSINRCSLQCERGASVPKQ